MRYERATGVEIEYRTMPLRNLFKAP